MGCPGTHATFGRADGPATCDTDRPSRAILRINATFASLKTRVRNGFISAQLEQLNLSPDAGQQFSLGRISSGRSNKLAALYAVSATYDDLFWGLTLPFKVMK